MSTPLQNAGRTGFSSFSSEKGSALFYILIAVVLFAALSYAVANMMRGGDPATLSKETAKAAASEVLDYASAVRRAVRSLQINGYDDTEISFENDVVTGYTNANCSEDGCKVFHPDGGAVIFKTPSATMLDSSFSSDSLYGAWRFIGQSVEVDGVGTDGNGTDSYDIMMVLPFIRRDICLEINKRLLGQDKISEEAGGFGAAFNKYDGTFSSTNAAVFENPWANPTVGDGVRAGCFCDSGDSSCPVGEDFYFYQVLIAR